MRSLALLRNLLILAGSLAAPALAQPGHEQHHTFFHFPRAGAASSPWKVAALCQAYQFPTGLAGGGVIGILELGGGYTQSDLDKFSQLNNLPTITVTDVSVNGGHNNYGTSSADYEVELDIEVAAAAYYYATGTMPAIKVFFAPNSSASFVDVINAAVAQGCDVLSISWGSPEKNWGNYLQQVESAAQAAAISHGLVVFAASGDSGSTDGARGSNVDGPASCPHVIGCGGTTKGATETVWGSSKPRSSGTGGGYSTSFPTQAFQVGAPAGSGRLVPDVAANADPNTGYKIVVRGAETIVGGTSAVSPLYAGLFAALGHKLGFVTPTLWATKADFTDITTGTNGAYKAVAGPDACTGLGVPKGNLLATLFAGPHATFQVAAVGTTSGASNGSIAINRPATGLVSLATGSGLGGNFAAVVVNGGGSSRIYGIGGGLGTGVNLFTFAGSH